MHVLRDIKFSAVCPALMATAGLSAPFDMTPTPWAQTPEAPPCREGRHPFPCKALLRHTNSHLFHSSFLTVAKRTTDVTGAFAVMAESRRRGTFSREGCSRKKIRLSLAAALSLFWARGGTVRISRPWAERCGARMPETALERTAYCCPPVLDFGFCA